MIVDLFHWSLWDIDNTDMESLLTFIIHYPHWKDKQTRGTLNKEVYADQVDWL
jgi:hypothetical protein